MVYPVGVIVSYDAFLLAGSEVTGIASLAGIVVVSQTAIILKMMDTREKADQRHADIIREITNGIHSAVDALRDTRVALMGQRQ